MKELLHSFNKVCSSRFTAAVGCKAQPQCGPPSSSQPLANTRPRVSFPPVARIFNSNYFSTLRYHSLSSCRLGLPLIRLKSLTILQDHYAFHEESFQAAPSYLKHPHCARLTRILLHSLLFTCDRDSMIEHFNINRLPDRVRATGHYPAKVPFTRMIHHLSYAP
ncbi:hypothetical protein BDZ45DRAFT_473863 [Acephala macrosclerotiorum]|nr:hypothetical protein BDZ45DRAFT_473863 [Acephala macrosclerotiorum]